MRSPGSTGWTRWRCNVCDGMPASARRCAAREVGARPFDAVTVALRGRPDRGERRRLAGPRGAFKRDDPVTAGENLLHDRALRLAEVRVRAFDLVAGHAADQGWVGRASGPHGGDGVALEREHVLRGERPARHARWLRHGNEFVVGHALGELGANGRGGHLAHRSPQGVAQEGALVHHRLPLEVAGFGERDRFVCGHGGPLWCDRLGPPMGGAHDGRRLIAVGVCELAMPAVHLILGVFPFGFTGAVGRDLRSAGPATLGRIEVGLDLLTTGTRRLEVRGGVPPNLGLTARAALDLVPEGREAHRQFGAVHGREVLLRLVEFVRLERPGLTRVPFRDVEDDDVRVELRRGVPVHRARAVMLEGRRHPAAGRLGGLVAADARLHIPLTFFERGGDAGAVGLAHPVVAADECREGHALRRGERRIPRRAMRGGRDRLAVLVRVWTADLVLHDGGPGERVLAIGETLEVSLLDRTHEPPLGRQPPVPLAADLVAVRVVVRAGVGEFLRVIGVHLRGAERLGDRHHDGALNPTRAHGAGRSIGGSLAQGRSAASRLSHPASSSARSDATCARVRVRQTPAESAAGAQTAH